MHARRPGPVLMMILTCLPCLARTDNAPPGEAIELPPDLLWFTLQTGSEKGLQRVLEAEGGRPLHLQSYRCDSIPSRQGANVVWGPCVVRYRVDGGTREERLFGLILERGGRFKFVSYGNKL